MDEIHAESPVDGAVETQIRRVTLVDDDGSDSTCNSDIDGSNFTAGDEGEDFLVEKLPYPSLRLGTPMDVLLFCPWADFASNARQITLKLP